jgi:hypothetical protein
MAFTASVASVSIEYKTGARNGIRCELELGQCYRRIAIWLGCILGRHLQIQTARPVNITSKALDGRLEIPSLRAPIIIYESGHSNDVANVW